MKIAVIGNCYIDTVAACLKLAFDAEIETHWTKPSRRSETAALVERIDSFDVICAQQEIASLLKDPPTQPLHGWFIRFPVLNFSGFQPDNVVIPCVRGAMGCNHSALIGASHLLGLPPGRCVRLFNRFVYSSLGYFERFAAERTRFLARASGLGFDLAEAFERWPRPFTYDILHPKLGPAVSVAQQLARKIGGPMRTVDWDDPETLRAVDHTRFNAVWPIYPEIAEHLGLKPDRMVFRFSGAHESELPLGQFVRDSYALYAKTDRAILEKTFAYERDVLSNILVDA